MQCQFIPPPVILRNYVRYFWTLDFNIGPSERILKIFADRYPRLIFQCLDGHSHIRTVKGVSLPQAFLAGVMTRSYTYAIQGAYAHTGVSLYPHAVPYLFGLDACELTNQLPNMLHFCSPDLLDQIQEARCHAERIGIITQFLINRVQQKCQEDPFVKYCIFSPQNHKVWNLNDLIQKSALSERQIERRFQKSIGVSPKTFLRIARFEKALQLMQHSDFDHLSHVAFDLNYADQSHFTRDFKAFSGLTPRAYLQSRKLVEESASFLKN